MKHQVIIRKNFKFTEDDNEKLKPVLIDIIQNHDPVPATFTSLYKCVANSTEVHRYVSYHALKTLVNKTFPELRAMLQENTADYYDKAINLVIEEAVLAGDIHTAKWYIQTFKNDDAVVQLQTQDNLAAQVTQIPILNFNTSSESRSPDSPLTLDVTKESNATQNELGEPETDI